MSGSRPDHPDLSGSHRDPALAVLQARLQYAATLAALPRAPVVSHARLPTAAYPVASLPYSRAQIPQQIHGVVSHPNVGLTHHTVADAPRSNTPEILPELANCSKEARKQMIYVLMHLKRDNFSKPWGISFSKFDDAIIIGDSSQVDAKAAQWVYVVPGRHHELDPRQLFAIATTDIYNRGLQAYGRRISDANGVRHARLFPGDLIVALDGLKSKRFPNLVDVTRHFRKSLQITLVIVRKPQITTATLRFWNPQFNPVRLPDTPFQAAELAFRMWQQTLGARALGKSGNFLEPATVDNPQVYIYHQEISTPKTPVTNTKNTVSHPSSNQSNKTNKTLRVAVGTPLDFFAQIALSGMKRNVPASGAPAPTPSSNAKPKPTPTTEPVDVALLRNPIFKIKGQAIRYADNFESSPEEGSRAKLFLPPIHDFQTWMAERKQTWRMKRTRREDESWRNILFQSEEDGQALPYDDNLEFSPEDGSRAKLFLPPIRDFQTWMQERKQTWRKKYKWDEEERTVAVEFWKQHEGIETFDDWLTQSVAKWKMGYSWNKRKRRRLQEECEEIVHVSAESSEAEFQHWLHVRRNQWRMQRRKLQRKRLELQSESGDNVESNHATICKTPEKPGKSAGLSRKRLNIVSPEMAFINDIVEEQLEEEEAHQKVFKERPLMDDISFLFYAEKGAPDDVVIHCFRFLERREHGKLLCISKATSKALAERERIWKELCPSHWTLPRRPRKPWHKIYIAKLAGEELACQKRWDDLMLKCSATLVKGDRLQQIIEAVRKGEEDFGFRVNYVSSVVCERNSILNLAVIHQRHKVVRWLVDEKSADIETYDRGRFTPLLNAAWAGDTKLVRFFLQRGSSRAILGTGHYTEGLAPEGFEGLTAEQWARKKGHYEIAELIRLGL